MDNKKIESDVFVIEYIQSVNSLTDAVAKLVNVLYYIDSQDQNTMGADVQQTYTQVIQTVRYYVTITYIKGVSLLEFYGNKIKDHTEKLTSLQLLYRNITDSAETTYKNYMDYVTLHNSLTLQDIIRTKINASASYMQNIVGTKKDD